MDFDFQPVEPGTETFFDLGGQLENRHLRMDFVDIVDGGFAVIFEVREQINFVRQGHVADAKHQRIFNRFTLSFGHTEDDGPNVFTDIKFDRANQVPHIFNNQTVDIIQVEAFGTKTLSCRT